MLLQSDKLDYKHGEVVEFQIYNQVYNKIGLPNYRNIRCHGHLASSVANNGKVFCVKVHTVAKDKLLCVYDNGT